MMRAECVATLIAVDHIDELYAVLGTQPVTQLIGCFLDDLARVTTITIPDLVAKQDYIAVRATAHRLRGAALNLGCVGVANSCVAIETDRVEAMPNNVEEMQRTAIATIARLRCL